MALRPPALIRSPEALTPDARKRVSITPRARVSGLVLSTAVIPNDAAHSVASSISKPCFRHRPQMRCSFEDWDSATADSRIHTCDMPE